MSDTNDNIVALLNPQPDNATQNQSDLHVLRNQGEARLSLNTSTNSLLQDNTSLLNDNDLENSENHTELQEIVIHEDSRTPGCDESDQTQQDTYDKVVCCEFGVICWKY